MLSLNTYSINYMIKKKSVIKSGLIFTAFISTTKLSGQYELRIFTCYSLYRILDFVLVQNIIQLVTISKRILVEYQNEEMIT